MRVIFLQIQEQFHYTERCDMEINEINCATGETIIRPATKAEIDLRKKFQEAAEAEAALAE